MRRKIREGSLVRGNMLHNSILVQNKPNKIDILKLHIIPSGFFALIFFFIKGE